MPDRRAPQPFQPSRMDEQSHRLLWERVNWLLVEIERLSAGLQTGVTVGEVQSQVKSLAVALQAVQDSLTTGDAFVGFGTTQPISGDAVLAASGVGMSITGTSGSGVITIVSAATFRAAIGLSTPIAVASGGTAATTPAGARTSLGAAASGANTDLTSITGLTGALRTADGFAIQWGRVVVAMAADANQSLGGSEYSRRHIVMSGGTVLTATRDITMPTTDGAEWVVRNGTSGGQSLVFKTAAGAGVTVANGMTAIVRCDGTDIVRVTADV